MLGNVHFVFFPVIFGLFLFAGTRASTGWRRLREDAAWLEEATDAPTRPPSPTRTQGLPHFLWTLSEMGAGTQVVSAADASALYEEEVGTCVDELSRIASLSLLTGVCGTITGMLLAAQTGTDQAAFAKASGAFLVSIGGIVVAGLIVVAQTFLARRITRNAGLLARRWARFVAMTPATGSEDRDAAVAEHKIEDLLDQLHDVFESMPSALAEQQAELRKTIETTCGQFGNILDQSQWVVAIAAYQREKAQLELADTIDELSREVEMVRNDAQDLQQLVKHNAEVVTAVKEMASTMRDVSATATDTMRHVSNEAGASQREYLVALTSLRGGFETALRDTNNDLANLHQQIRTMSEDHRKLVETSLQKVGNEIANQLRQSSLELQKMQEHMFTQLADLKNLAPGVRDAIDTIEPGAKRASDAIRAVVAATETTSKSVETTLAKVGERLDHATEIFARGMKAVEGSLQGLGTAAQHAIQSTRSDAQNMLRFTRWIVVPAGAVTVLFTLWMLAQMTLGTPGLLLSVGAPTHNSTTRVSPPTSEGDAPRPEAQTAFDNPKPFGAAPASAEPLGSDRNPTARESDGDATP